MSEIKQGYKQTKVGIIPEDWEVVSLNEGAVFLDHKRKPLKDEYRQKIQGQYPYYGASGIIDYVNDYIFDEELILIGEDGANIIDRNSRLVFLANGKYWVNNHAHVLKAKPNFNNYFLCEFLESLKYDKYNTGTAQPKLNKEIVSNIPIIKPPIKEQEKIAEILTTWDEAITKQTELLRAKELQKKALMQKLLSGEVRFGEFSDEWEEIQVSEIFKNIGGTSLENEVIENGKYKFISIGNYSVDGRYIDNQQRINLNGKTKDKLLYKDNLVMVLNDKTASGDLIGSTILINEDNTYIYNQRSERLICSNKILPLYAWFKLNSKDFRKKIFSLSQGGTQIYINFPAVKKIKIKLPSLPEQQKIAEVLSLADDEINLLKKELDELKQQKKALMQKLLTGEVRVKV
jgi:type I restriction enzyme S subunit